MISAVNEFLDDLRGGRMTEAPVVSVEQGQLQGRVATSPTGKSFYSFQGIPYAKPPLGSLRFKAPQPPEPWDGVRDATSEGNISAQIDIPNKQYIGDENCLFLNVYTPNLDGSFLPVMVFIHGGGFKFGSGNTNLYGPDYLVEKDVIIVTVNYRCGVLGFLSLNTPEVPGNAGMKDVVEALRWVKQNIENFGGNPRNMTVFGESAGGCAVSLLTVSPLTKNMINKAIIQSGTALGSFILQKTPLENARTIAGILGCDSRDPEEILDYLRACSAKEIVEAHEKMNANDELIESLNLFTVVIEKEFPLVEAFITESFYDLLTSGRVADIPIMIGACTLEFGSNKKFDLEFFIPDNLNIEKGSAESLEIAEKFKELYFKGDEQLGRHQLISDRFLKVDTYRVAQYLVQVTNKPIYYYNFDYVGALNIYDKIFQRKINHAGHMDDLAYLFRNDFQTDVEISEEDNITRERMVRLWTNFAKTGNPTPEESHYINVTWLPVTKDNHYYLNIGSELTLGINLDKERMEYWDSLYRKYFRIWEHPKNSEELLVKYDPPVVVGTYTESVTVTSSSITENSEFISDNLIITTESKEMLDDGSFESTTKVTAPVQVSDVINIIDEPAPVVEERTPIVEEPIPTVEEPTPTVEEPAPVVEEPAPLIPEFVPPIQEPTPVIKEAVVESPKHKETGEPVSFVFNNHVNGDRKVRTSNEIKMVTNKNGAPKDVIRANDPPEDDLPKNIGVNKFVNFFESLGGKK